MAHPQYGCPVCHLFRLEQGHLEHSALVPSEWQKKDATAASYAFRTCPVARTAG